MDGIIPELRFADKGRLVDRVRRCRDAGLKTRYLIVMNLSDGRAVGETARAQEVNRSTVYRVARRFREQGELGLLDRREDNGDRKLDERFLRALYEVVRGTPPQHGWQRPTWTREMLVETLYKRTGMRVHVTTMSRALHMIRARRGRPRPVVGCPWSKQAKNRRLAMIRGQVSSLPRGHVVVYEDEVGIHLNPKIGLDWMACGQQKEVLTPGQNVKRYVAGALNAATGEVVYVEGAKKRSELFVALLDRLRRTYSRAKVIHVILDNFRIHHSRITEAALKGFNGRIVLHFLPPYCPNDNRIERLWEDLHARVTRNHQCRSIDELMTNVRAFLDPRLRRATRHAA